MPRTESFPWRRKPTSADRIKSFLEQQPQTDGSDATEIYNSNARVTVKERLSKARKQYDSFMYEHGRTIADTATRARRIGGIVESGLILSNKPKVARAVSIPVLATDLVDGHSARKHKDGATFSGGMEDQKVDKERSLMVEAALVAKGRMDWKHLAIRAGSDFVMNKVIRPYFQEKGIDTKAGWAGKASSASVAVAEVSAMGESNPQFIQNTATGAKVGRVIVYTFQWGRELKKKNKEQKLDLPHAA